MSQGGYWLEMDAKGLELAEGETITTVRFAPDGRRGIAGGTASAVFFTTDGGRTWNRTEGLGSVTKELVFVQAVQQKPTKERPVNWQAGDKSPSEEKDDSRYSFLMMTGDEAYILKSHPIGPEQPLSLIQSSVEENDVLRRSVIGEDILEALQKLPEDGGKPALIELTLMRIASMTILFFLVQLLVRLYQYNLRLASFLDSRADAVLLARTFASREKIPFDDLVRSMAPDDYDFKPQPRPLHEAVLNRLPLQRNP